MTEEIHLVIRLVEPKLAQAQTEPLPVKDIDSSTFEEVFDPASLRRFFQHESTCSQSICSPDKSLPEDEAYQRVLDEHYALSPLNLRPRYSSFCDAQLIISSNSSKNTEQKGSGALPQLNLSQPFNLLRKPRSNSHYLQDYSRQLSHTNKLKAKKGPFTVIRGESDCISLGAITRHCSQSTELASPKSVTQKDMSLFRLIKAKKVFKVIRDEPQSSLNQKRGPQFWLEEEELLRPVKQVKTQLFTEGLLPENRTPLCFEFPQKPIYQNQIHSHSLKSLQLFKKQSNFA